MGGGKGDIERFVVPIVPGKIIFEIAGVSEEMAHQALKRAGAKLPFKTKIVSQMEV